ncbi:hypothetical protein BN2476_320202 [Paraburkholderia piptadeniae]|uniref:Uncharacterized protein n=1 Tax=Paraburkholderia piptadeniae TaxID=1701573 RepID=A0A1N7S5L1_9BURK|nr:hypothetical protein BN2476_320202 [Paraburkholderia piptadeniae]
MRFANRLPKRRDLRAYDSGNRRGYHQNLSRVTADYDALFNAMLCISYYKVEIRVQRCFVIFESSSR